MTEKTEHGDKAMGDVCNSVMEYVWCNKVHVRDFFAGCALIGHLASRRELPSVEEIWREAAAMMVERDKVSERMIERGRQLGHSESDAVRSFFK